MNNRGEVEDFHLVKYIVSLYRAGDRSFLHIGTVTFEELVKLVDISYGY